MNIIISDLADFSEFSRWNKGNKKLVVFVDCFSRYAFCAMTKSTKSSQVAHAFDSIMQQSHRKPEFVCSDQGSEFKGAFAELCERRNIKQFMLTDSNTKVRLFVCLFVCHASDWRRSFHDT